MAQRGPGLSQAAWGAPVGDFFTNFGQNTPSPGPNKDACRQRLALAFTRLNLHEAPATKSKNALGEPLTSRLLQPSRDAHPNPDFTDSNTALDAPDTASDDFTTDPSDTKVLWDCVYAHKQALEMAYQPSAASSRHSTPWVYPGKLNPLDMVLLTDHFPTHPSQDTGAETSRNNAAAAMLHLALGPSSRRSPLLATAAELRRSVEGFLALREPMVKPRNTVKTISWKPAWCLKGRAEHTEVEMAAWESQCGTQLADITFWLQRDMASTLTDVAPVSTDQLFWARLPFTTYAIDATSMICPYLSVIIVGDGETLASAMDRLAKTAGDALLNRFMLHRRANPDCQDLDEVRHYGLIFSWNRLYLYVLEPDRVFPPTKAIGYRPEYHDDGNRAPATTPSNRPSLQPGTKVAIDTTEQRHAYHSSSQGPTMFNAPPIRLPVPTKSTSLANSSLARTTRAKGKDIGGHMRCLFLGQTAEEGDVKQLGQWILAIHTWALTNYAESVEYNIRAIKN